MREGSVKRDTRETQIELKINLDGSGKFQSKINCGFIEHMLELFASHGRFDLTINAAGDTHVDYHHLVEDLGISLGQAISKALGDKKGITRYGSFMLPMDESLITAAVDISGREFLVFDCEFYTEKIGDFDTQLMEEFFLGFVRGLKCTLHINKISGKNSHHIAEAIFKGVARALAIAVAFDERFKDELPSTKGLI